MLRMPAAFGASALVLALATVQTAAAQTGGGVDQTVGGTPFMEAAKPGADTPNFHSNDGKLTFAIISHTAGNGFFDPAYVGAQVAADVFGINLIKLGPEAPIDDYPRQFEIINQVLQDPTIDGIAITTGQAGAYNDVIAKAEELGIPVATFNSWDPGLKDRNNISHTGQDVLGGRDWRRGDGQVHPRQRRDERLDPVPQHHDDGQRRGQQPHDRGVRGRGEGAQRRRPAGRFRDRCRA